MQRGYKTLLLIRLMRWNAATFEDYFWRYVEHAIPERVKQRFTLNDMLRAAVILNVVSYFESDDEGWARTDEFLDTIFACDGSRESYLFTSELRERIRIHTNDLAEVFECDIVDALAQNGISYHDGLDVGEVVVRGEDIHINFIDLERRSW